ncbi:MAG: N-acetylmuramic acid 6-phosphate etherase [Elusimicrobiota bacterium]
MRRLSVLAGVYRRLPTEQSNAASRRIDVKSVSEILQIMRREDAKVPRAVARESPRIERAVKLISGCLASGGRLFFVGAGTSGRLGVIEAAECPPTFGTKPSQIQAIMAGGRGAVFRSKEGAEDDLAAGARELRRLARRGDVVVGIAASGVTPFVRGALAAARESKARTVLVTSNARSRVPEAELVIALRVGPEIISGSTRMKAATAAKLVLNTLTAASMIRLGKVYDGWMVDLRPSSYKLRQRALRLLCLLGRVSPARAQRILKSSGGSVKTGIVMAHKRVPASEARRRLRSSSGSLRRVLEA